MMKKKFNFIISILPFIDVFVGLGILALLNLVEAQTKVMSQSLSITESVNTVFPIGVISIVVKISAIGLIFVSIVKAIVLYSEKSKTL